MGKLIKYIKPYITMVIIALIFTACATTLSILAPTYVGKLTNEIDVARFGLTIDLTKVATFGIILTVFYSLSMLLHYFQNFIMAGVNQGVSKSLRAKISKKINKVPLKYFDNHSTGDTLSRVANDVDTIGQTLNQSVASLFHSAVMLIGVMIAMFVTCWQLSLVAVITVPISFILIIIVMKFSQKYFIAQQQNLGSLNGQIEENYSGLNVVKAFNCEEKVKKVLTTRRREQKTLTLKNVKGKVEFKNVKFGYDENKIIIKDFSAKIEPGQKVAIVGPTGAGKTTMINLLMRFYEINGGEILIDDIPINQLKRENVRNLFGMVLQDTWLFNGTIKENIVYSKENVTDEEIYNACEAANIDHFIRTLPKGYDMVLEDDSNISSGQRQLLTIARAMVQNSPMLILDEATSNVDTRTEHLIQDAMDKVTKGRTSFVIAHRLSTIKNADLILVMKDGDIIEFGNHNKLLEQKGFYYDLYNSQFALKSIKVEDETAS
ncbi:atp-binding cassette sub-family b [Holotrichia oblita]|nr:atp-binding cassette sub-family b [Holotrichia oblita]